MGPLHETMMPIGSGPCYGSGDPLLAEPPDTRAPEPLNSLPEDSDLKTPSRLQIGAPVHVAGTVVGVLFREGAVSYEVALGTTDELGEPDVTLVRSYDVQPRMMEFIGGEWR